MTIAAAPSLPARRRRGDARAAARRPGHTLRRRILLVIAAIDVGCCLAAAALEIVNARRAARVEVAASLGIAEPLVRETVANFQRDLGRDIADLRFALPGVRHVRIEVRRPDGELVASRASERSSDADPAPRWFEWLIATDAQRVEIPVTSAGALKGTVLVHGEDADEIAEVWEDMTTLGILFVGLNGLGLAIFGLALRRMTAPLEDLASALSDLERQRLDRRLPIPDIRELAALAERFNALASGLGAERAKNVRLTRQMVSVQDDERRQIASELHDELGPCLFGLQANLELLHNSFVAGEIGRDERSATRLAAAIEISERLQTLNRAMLRRLKPLALGDAPIGETLGGLIADFARRHADHVFRLDVEDIAASYGPLADLTIYRGVQEGVTNALRHAACRTIDVSVSEHAVPRPSVVIEVQDDGAGLSRDAFAGFGLSGLSDRLQALQGSYALDSTPSGARLRVIVPIGDEAALRDVRP